MRFSKTQRYLADTVTALAAIQQASRRKRNIELEVRRAVEQFFNTAFSYQKFGKEPQIFWIIPLQHGSPGSITIDKNARKMHPEINAYAVPIIVGSPEISQITSLFDKIKEDALQEKEQHFEIISIEGKYQTAPPMSHVLDEIIYEESMENSNQNRLIINDFQRRVIDRSKEGYWTDTSKKPYVTMDRAQQELRIKIFSSTRFGDQLCSMLKQEFAYEIKQTKIPEDSPYKNLFNLKGLDTIEWKGFIEIAITFMIHFFIEFNGLDRLQICPECGSVFFQEREGRKIFCGNNCSTMSAKKKDPQGTCRARQRSVIENYGIQVEQLGKEAISKPYRPYLLSAGDCLGCQEKFPLQGGKCPTLIEKNKKLIEAYFRNKENEKREKCYKRQTEWLGKEIRSNKKRPENFFKRFCVACHENSKKRIIGGKCPQMLIEMDRLNPDIRKANQKK